MVAADNSIKILPSPDALAESAATDYISGAHYQRIKAGWGADGSYHDPDTSVGNRFPVERYGAFASGTASVTASANLSNAVDCRGYDPVGISVPLTFDGTQINFQVSTDN